MPNEKPNKSLIEMFICIVENINNNLSINIHDHNKSAVMGDIEIVLQINNSIHNFIQNNLSKEVNKVDNLYKSKIINVITELEHCLIRHTLYILSLISDKVQNT
jgi:hypothetical protein